MLVIFLVLCYLVKDYLRNKDFYIFRFKIVYYGKFFMRYFGLYKWFRLDSKVKDKFSL